MDQDKGSKIQSWNLYASYFIHVASKKNKGQAVKVDISIIMQNYKPGSNFKSGGECKDKPKF